MSQREYPDQPRVGVGAVVIRDGCILLVRRGIEPSRGLWAIPGGALKLGETLQQCAEREIQEETGVVIRAGYPIYTFDFLERDEQGRLRFHYVIVDLAADYVTGEPQGADDALEARWVSPAGLGDIAVSPNTLRLLADIRFTEASAS